MGPCEQILKRNMEAYKTIEQVTSTAPKDIPYGITNPIPHFSGVQRVPSNQLQHFVANNLPSSNSPNLSSSPSKSQSTPILNSNSATTQTQTHHQQQQSQQQNQPVVDSEMK